MKKIAEYYDYQIMYKYTRLNFDLKGQQYDLKLFKRTAI
jgi:hypothetical protein